MKKMTIENFLKNPTGKYSAGFARRDLIIANLNQRYNAILSKHGTFKFKAFKVKNDYVFYFKIPSETVYHAKKEFHYDVVIRFYADNPAMLNSAGTLNDYSINIFSNSPDFMFTYAYWYNKDSIIDPKLKHKVSSKALNNEPVIKNPNGIYGFEKSVYYALLFIKMNKFHIKHNLGNILDNKLSYGKVISEIKTTEQKYKEYNELKLLIKKENKEQKIKKTKNTVTNKTIKKPEKKQIGGLKNKNNKKK